jgi:hypothetical protein
MHVINLQDVLVQGFNVFSGLTDQDAVLDSVSAKSTAAAAALRSTAITDAYIHKYVLSRISVHRVKPYLLASALYPVLQPGEFVSANMPNIVITRGMELSAKITTDVLAKQLVALCCVLVLDAAMLLLAITLFLKPLEKVCLFCVCVVYTSATTRTRAMFASCCSVTDIFLYWQYDCCLSCSPLGMQCALVRDSTTITTTYDVSNV